uniref:Uncharacterized protein n=1 Tax=Panagrolaimus sp. ES5 TaxID=591445 RepID=A0AC34FQR4_9BILA
MKLNYSISIFALLLISLPLYAATTAHDVVCPYGSIDGIKSDKNCSTSCAIYICNGTTHRNSSFHVHSIGCPSDFFHDCSNFDEEVDHINGTDFNALKFSNDRVTYVSSGCGGNEENVTECLWDKLNAFQTQVDDMRKNDKRYKNGEEISFLGESPFVGVTSNASDFVTELPSMPSALPKMSSALPEMVSDAADMFTESPLSSSVTPDLGTLPPFITPDAPVLNYTSPDFIPNPLPTVPSVFTPDAPVLSSLSPNLIPNESFTLLPPSIMPVGLIPDSSASVTPDDTSSKPASKKPKSTATPKKRTTTPTTTTSTVAVADTNPSTESQDLKKGDDVTVPVGETPAPEKPATEKPGNASKRQEFDFWKKLGCFIIGTIFAAWIY